MPHRIDGNKLPQFAAGKLSTLDNSDQSTRLNRFYCGLCYAFIRYNYASAGVIAPKKTKTAMRRYLENRDNKYINASRFANDLMALESFGLLRFVDKLVELIVPTELVTEYQEPSSINPELREEYEEHCKSFWRGEDKLRKLNERYGAGDIAAMIKELYPENKYDLTKLTKQIEQRIGAVA